MKRGKLATGSALLIAGACQACGILGPDYHPALISWVEARLDPEHLILRVVGSAGCGGLDRVDADVLEGFSQSVVIVQSRAREADFQCLVPVVYDAELILSRPPGLHLRIAQAPAGDREDRTEMFTIWTLREGIAAFVGGGGVVEGVSGGCPRLRIGSAVPPGLAYPIEFPRQVELRDGDPLIVSGVLPEGVTSACDGGRPLWVERFTLAFPPDL